MTLRKIPTKCTFKFSWNFLKTQKFVFPNKKVSLKSESFCTFCIILKLNKINIRRQWEKGLGFMVSLLAFNSNDSSSNLAEVSSFYNNNVRPCNREKDCLPNGFHIPFQRLRQGCFSSKSILSFYEKRSSFSSMIKLLETEANFFVQFYLEKWITEIENERVCQPRSLLDRVVAYERIFYRWERERVTCSPVIAWWFT